MVRMEVELKLREEYYEMEVILEKLRDVVRDFMPEEETKGKCDGGGGDFVGN